MPLNISGETLSWCNCTKGRDLDFYNILTFSFSLITLPRYIPWGTPSHVLMFYGQFALNGVVFLQPFKVTGTIHELV